MSPSDALRTLPNVAGISAPKSRVTVLEQLLERYAELVDPMQSRSGTGDGEAIPLMPASYTATVRELERLIRQLRDDPRRPIYHWHHDGQRHSASTRRLWWHLNQWFLCAERRLVEPPLKVQRSKRKQLVKLQVDQHGRVLPQVRVFRNAEARYHIAFGALLWLSENWGLSVEPMLPSELLEAA